MVPLTVSLESAVTSSCGQRAGGGGGGGLRTEGPVHSTVYGHHTTKAGQALTPLHALPCVVGSQVVLRAARTQTPDESCPLLCGGAYIRPWASRQCI